MHDVLVIGGGPAGSSIAALLSERGHDVLVVEKDRHPRAHIGESLLPANIELFERLDVLDQVRNLGIVKAGADFNTFDRDFDPPRHDAVFSNQLDNSKPDYAFEVRRSEFDRMLLDNCRKKGATVVEQTRVASVEFAETNPVARIVAADGSTEAVRARFVVDASGRDTILAGQLGTKRLHPHHASAAVYSYFEGVSRRAGAAAGNLSLYWSDHGWIWLIPLRDDATSVGAVCAPDHLKQRRGTIDQYFAETLASGPAELSERLRNARRCAAVTTTGNYSYSSDRIAGDRWLMVGDAYAFVDPVFSSGVLLAMQSSFEALPAIEAWLRGDTRGYQRASRAYEIRHRRALAVFSWFIERFRTPAMKQLLMRPSNPLDVQRAVVSMLTGDVFHNEAIHWRLRLFKLIYAATSLRLSLSAR